MTALAAARLGDPVGHPFDWGAAGAAVGAAIGAGVAQLAAEGAAAHATVWSVGLGFAFAGPLGGLAAGVVSHKVGRAVVQEAQELGAWLGGKIGGALGAWLGDTLGLHFDVTTGAILIGDFTVWVEWAPASRSCVDFALCERHPSTIPPMITTGSATVWIGKHPAARVSDTGACTFRILKGARHVYIGGDPETCECAKLWKKYRDAAEALISATDHDHRQRNAVISAAYADLYLQDRDFIWAGLAAYASKQVGCAMDHAQGAMRQGGELQRAGGAITVLGPPGSGAAGLAVAGYGTAADLAAGYTYEQLGEGNRALFLDIYPQHLFWQDAKKPGGGGIAKMIECAGSRTPPMEPEALAGFAALANGDRGESLKQLALHEQLKILQVEIYDDYLFRRILIANETGLPMTSPAAVNLGADCTGPHTHVFNKGWMSEEHGMVPELYDAKERMEWILGPIATDYQDFEGEQRHLDDLEVIKRRGGL